MAGGRIVLIDNHPLFTIPHHNKTDRNGLFLFPVLGWCRDSVITSKVHHYYPYIKISILTNNLTCPLITTKGS